MALRPAQTLVQLHVMSIFNLVNLRIRIALFQRQILLFLFFFYLLIVKQPCAIIDIAFVSKENAPSRDAFLVHYFRATDYGEVGEIFLKNVHFPVISRKF